jgi:hypothetical protein
MQHDRMRPSDRSLFDGMAAFIQQHLFKTVTTQSEIGVLAVAETAAPFNDSEWYWTDDNAKALELLCEPKLFDADPRYTNDAVDFILRMSQGKVIQRRHGPARLRVVSADPRAFRVETAFAIVEGDLSRGVVRHALRFNDNRTVTAAQHTGNQISFLYRKFRFTRKVELSINAFDVEVDEDWVKLSHSSVVLLPWTRQIAGVLRYVYVIRADNPAITLNISLKLAPDVDLRDVILTSAFSQLGSIRNLTYDSVAARQGRQRVVKQVTTRGRQTIHTSTADYSAVIQNNGSPGFAYAIHILLRDGARLSEIVAQVRERGRLDTLRYHYRLPDMGKGEEVVISEARMLTGGGYYDDLDHYKSVMEDGSGAGTVDPSMTYDIGAELNAIAVHLLFARTGRYAAPPSDARLTALQSWYDRHVDRYFDFIAPGSPGDLDRIFTRGLAFVAMSLDCMVRATGHETYRQRLDVAVVLILRMRRRLPSGLAQLDGTFGDEWSQNAPFLDNHAACILALARAARHGDAEHAISDAISEAIFGIKLFSGPICLQGNDFIPFDSLAVVNPHQDVPPIGSEYWAYKRGLIAKAYKDLKKAILLSKRAHANRLAGVFFPRPHVDTGYWNYKLALTLRALLAVQRASRDGILQVSASDHRSIAVKVQICRDALMASVRHHETSLEVLTCHTAGETNSETQPWAALGLDPIIDEMIETLDCRD